MPICLKYVKGPPAFICRLCSKACRTKWKTMRRLEKSSKTLRGEI
jgi:hypothetical protein